MAKGPCERFHPHLSAYADGTLPPKRWEQVSYHLAGCHECRDEVAAITAVCSTLSSCRGSRAPEALSARLESIAGDDGAGPLYMAAGAGELPSLRRTRLRRATQGSVVLIAVMLSAAVLAVLVAPTPATVADPLGAARELYSRSLTAISVNEAVGAMLLANERGADFGASETYEQRLSDTSSVAISAEEAAALLMRAAEADLTLTGTQQVWASDGEGLYRTARVGITKVAGEGAELEVFDASGSLFSSSFQPEFGVRSLTAPPDWSYARGAAVEQVAGRDAVWVQASDGQQPVARWWLDVDTGLLLWAERYDTAGNVNVGFGYRQLTLDAGSLGQRQTSQLIALEPATSAGEAGWCVGLEDCPQSLAGLPLVAYAVSERHAKASMDLVYSDGYHTAVVGWSEGVLEEGLEHTSRGAEMSVAVWQAGQAVISVACDCDPALMAEVTSELPSPSPFERTIGARIQDGLARLIEVG